MLSFDFNPDSMPMPGYLGFQKLLQRTSSLEGAWDELEIFDHRSAMGFLRDKTLRLVQDNRPAEDLVDLAMAFACMAVLADREERGSFVEGAPPSEALSVDHQIEREQTGGDSEVRF